MKNKAVDTNRLVMAYLMLARIVVEQEEQAAKEEAASEEGKDKS
ncbi:MAG: hypothetical protein WB709_09810 [Solirubrobacteraceae bacterium]